MECLCRPLWHNMAGSECVKEFKVLQKLEFSREKANVNSVSWSSDNRLAIATNATVCVVNLKGVKWSKESKCKVFQHSKSCITTKGEKRDYDIDVDFERSSITVLTEEPCYGTATLDPALFGNTSGQILLCDIVAMEWSPTECDHIGRSVLAILFNNNELSFYACGEHNKWVKIADITELHYQQLWREDFFMGNLSIRGKPQQDPRKQFGSRWKKYTEWQVRKYLLNFTAISWCPNLVVCKGPVMSKFMFFATVVKNGNLFVWQGMVPLVATTSGVQRVLAAQTSLFYPCSLAWSHIDVVKGVTYLACGNTEGLIKVFFIKITTTTLPQLSFVKAYTFNTVADEIIVEHLTWHNKGNQLFLACSKGPHISVFISYIMEGGSLSKPVQKVVTGLHLLNITGLAISPTGMLYSTSAEGTLQQYQIGGCKPSTLIKYSPPSSFGFNGVSVSPNGAFLAVFEYRRKLHEPKQGISFKKYTHCQVAILPLMADNENEEQLAKWKPQSVEFRQFWDCLFLKELYLDTANTLTPVLQQNCSTYRLQYIRTLCGMKLRSLKKELEASTKKSDMETDASPMLETREKECAKMVRMIGKIEERIAVFTMQKILNVFLGSLSKTKDLTLTNEPLMLSICCWLASKSTSLPTSQLLTKYWNIFQEEIKNNAPTTINPLPSTINPLMTTPLPTTDNLATTIEPMDTNTDGVSTTINPIANKPVVNKPLSTTTNGIPTNTNLAQTIIISTNTTPSTIHPVTINPTTINPTTIILTTINPTTINPTTINLTAINPITITPTTINPVIIDATTINPPAINPPTINPPTINPPTINPPTINPPTINPPTINPPTINPPTLNPPTLNPPTLNPPTINPPTVNPPTVNPPTINPPMVNPPTVNPPTVNPPMVNPPTVNPPTVNPPTINPPTINSPTINPPTINPPTINPPTVNPPMVNPSTINPSTINPPTINPPTINPTTINPTTINPTTINPTTINPTTINPPTLNPSTIIPTTIDPIPITITVPTTINVPTTIGHSTHGQKVSDFVTEAPMPFKDMDLCDICMCGNPVPLQDLRYGQCLAGHVWPRCALTFKLLEGSNCRVCQNCDAHALIQGTEQQVLADWSRLLLQSCVSCTYCGGWFENV